MGRKFRPGSDYVGAEAAFRSAVKLDPDDKATVANLAILLEHNRDGLRYGPGSNLKEAVAQYRSLSSEKIKTFGLQNNLAFDLFYAGEFSDAQKYALSLSPQPAALIIACEAALNGSPSALAEARRRTAGEDQFKQNAKTAGYMLANLRLYPVAADLLDAGASGDDASETAAYASLYRKTQPHEDLVFPDNPEGVASRFALMNLDANLTLDQFRSIGSRNGKTAMAVEEVLKNLVKEARGLRTDKSRTGAFVDVGVDLSLTRVQPKAQGDDLSGYKVSLYRSTNYKGSRYIVKEEGHYKLLATTDYPAPIGLEILDRTAANNLVGARVLLDWLREDQHLAGGDDPLAGSAFPRFWTKGKDADLVTMKLAAASILTASKQTAPQGLAVLEAARDSARNDAERLNISLALLDGYTNLDEYEKALSVSADLARQYPESARMFNVESFDLRALGRFEAADKLAADRLHRTPDDIDAMRALVWNAITREDYVKAHTLAQSIIGEGKAEAQDLNTTAWGSLFTPKVDPSDVEAALKATQLSDNNTSYSHTLGCLYLEVGKIKEGREVLVRSMDLLKLDEPNPDYWYAFGRIAEQYGEREVAIADYNRVTKPKKPIQIPGSSYRLAQLRLQALHAAAPSAASKAEMTGRAAPPPSAL